MPKVINLRKRKKRRKLIGKREIIVAVVAMIMATAGIKAADSLQNSKAAADGSVNGCPADMTFVPSATGGFCIDKYEESVGAGCPNADPVSQSETRVDLDYTDCRPVSAAGKLPWRYISQDQAAVACAKAGKRLATNQEWLAAALGTPDPDSGWGSNDCQVDDNWSRQPGLTGSAAKCKSAAGAYDMVGNVWEWVQGTVNDGVYAGKTLPPQGYIDSTDGASFPGATSENTPNENYNDDYFWIKDTGLRGIARGGYWDNKSDAGSYAMYIVIPPSFVGDGVGFRCAK